MTEKFYQTPKGEIHYWVEPAEGNRPWLVFLPGLTADHTLFEKQVEAFRGSYPILMWDAPGHGASRPFVLDFSLADKARWLHELLAEEGIEKPVLIGQSMGGYVSQCFLEHYPGEAGGFVCIDSAPLAKQYYRNWEIAVLKHTKLMYSLYPWERLKKDGAKGCAETEYGYRNMYEMMDAYQKAEYCDLVSHGYRILAQAVEADLPYAINCPVRLICGEQDKAGYTKKYNEAWNRETRLPIHWIPNAGHNSNADQPETVNAVIGEFLEHLEALRGKEG